jgi:hypothetical protein
LGLGAGTLLVKNPLSIEEKQTSFINGKVERSRGLDLGLEEEAEERDLSRGYDPSMRHTISMIMIK